MFNAYYTRARLFPTLLTSVPMIILINRIIAYSFAAEAKEVSLSIQIFSNTSISAAIIFLLVQINRFVSKEVFQRWLFENEIKMPTVDYLLYSSTYFDLTIKNTIRNKISEKYKMQLPSLEEERNNEDAARKSIAITISQIRNDLRQNKLLLQHNIEYGFIRNLIGGSLMAVAFSVALILYGISLSSNVITNVGVISALVYLFPILLSKPLINKYGHYYAKILFEQFLSQ